MQMMKRLCAAVLSAGLLLGSTMSVRAEESDKDFDKFLDEVFVQLNEDDYLTLHYAVRDYQAYGITKPELTVGDASWESFQNVVDEYNEILSRLHAFDYDSLSATQKNDYDALSFYLEHAAQLNSYPGVASYFGPGDGIHDQLLTNFTEFVFYEKQDIDDYLTVLADVPNYLADAIDVTKRQAEKGFFLTDAALDGTLESIANFTAKTKDNQLIVIFDENVAALDGLSDEEIKAYQKQNRELVLNKIIPAYEKTARELENLRGSRTYEGGLCKYPDGGADYYSALVSYKTSSNDSIQSQLDLCTDVLRDLINDYITLVMTDPAAEEAYELESVPTKTPEEVLEYLSTHLDDYPPSADVTYRYSYLDPSVANDSVIAYYMTPAVDSYRDNVIRINGDNVSDENDLYETLAHEGFPGHLYQNTWYLATKPSPVRSLLGFIGYSEGWAMYSQMVAWDISGLSEGAVKLHKIYSALSYIEDAAVDLGVNGLGWDVSDLETYLNSIGLNPDSAPDLYDYVIQYPGMLLPYGVGLARFMTMREIAEESLGKSFVLKDFHEVLLTNGERPFDLVQADLNAYLGKNGGYEEPDAEPEDDEKAPLPFQPEGYENWLESTYHNPLNEKASTAAGIFAGGAAILAVIVFYLNHRRNRKGPLA